MSICFNPHHAKRRTWLTALVLVCVLDVSQMAVASEGVLEINALCAEQTGCFAGDSPGYPVTIESPGSYRLTGNLDFSALPNPQNLTGIQINASEVTVDLNGFSIIGPADCTGTPVTSCQQTGVGNGVFVSGSQDEVAIKNGQVRGAGNVGVSCFSGCRLNDLTVTHSGLFGIFAVNSQALVKDCIVRRNGGTGISGSGHFEGNISQWNGGDGFSIFGPQGNIVIQNQATDNVGNGFTCDDCQFMHNRSGLNDQMGVSYSGECATGANHFFLNAMGNETGTCGQILPNICRDSACP